MTTPSLSEIRSAICDQLTAAVSGISFYPRRPRALQMPAGILRRTQGPTWETMGGGATVGLELVLVVSSALGERASETLDTFVEASGETSIRGALEADRTLGGLVLMLTVEGWGEEELIDENEVPYPGSTLPIEVSYR